MKNRFLKLSCLSTLLLLSACRTTIDNLTPARLPQNSSHVYTMTMAVHVPSRKIIPQSLRPFIVIDGKRQPMKRSELGKNIFVCDYRFPAWRDRAHYYYELEYDIPSVWELLTRTKRSRLYEFQISNRCLLSLDAYRGISGNKVAVLGRGFRSDDRVVFDDRLATTRVPNDHMMEFIVPPVEADRNYRLTLQGSGGSLNLGDFFVDPAPIYASPETLQLSGSERQDIAFRVDHPVPSSGLYLNVTTDIPEDIVMPEVAIPGGQCSVNTQISGMGYQAKGSLFIAAPGYQLLVIPVNVEGRAKETPAIPAASAFAPFPEEATPQASSIDIDHRSDEDVIVIE
ncbi:MAG: hypothetical protein LBT57_02070 [Puniceicoccales bacterium]|jgi:hypothetical protein|nr:hypothetical protein [Puniceicoccales bacterium]